MDIIIGVAALIASPAIIVFAFGLLFALGVRK